MSSTSKISRVALFSDWTTNELTEIDPMTSRVTPGIKSNTANTAANFIHRGAGLPDSALDLVREDMKTNQEPTAKNAPTPVRIAPGIIIPRLSSPVEPVPMIRSGKPGSIKNIPNKAANPILPRPGFSAVSSSG